VYKVLLEDGRSIPSFEMVMKFLKAYRVNIEEFLRETGYLSTHVGAEYLGKVKRVPVISWTQAGHWQEMWNTLTHSDYDEYVETDRRGIFALRVRGDSMVEKEFYIL
jgi:SOS-response transcriptional repressor LexA